MVVSLEDFFPWKNAPVHSVDIVQMWMATNRIRLLQYLPNSQDLALADYFCCEEGEGGGGWHLLDTGQTEEYLDKGHQNHRYEGVYRCLQTMA